MFFFKKKNSTTFRMFQTKDLDFGWMQLYHCPRHSPHFYTITKHHTGSTLNVMCSVLCVCILQHIIGL